MGRERVEVLPHHRCRRVEFAQHVREQHQVVLAVGVERLCRRPVDGRVDVPSRPGEEVLEHVGGGARFDGVILEQRVVGEEVGQPQRGTADAGAHVEHTEMPPKETVRGHRIEDVLDGCVVVGKVVDGVRECRIVVVLHVPAAVVVLLDAADRRPERVARLAPVPVGTVLLDEQVLESTGVLLRQRVDASEVGCDRSLLDGDERAVVALDQSEVRRRLPEHLPDRRRVGLPLDVLVDLLGIDGPDVAEVPGVVPHAPALVVVHGSSSFMARRRSHRRPGPRGRAARTPRGRRRRPVPLPSPRPRRRRTPPVSRRTRTATRRPRGRRGR